MSAAPDRLAAALADRYTIERQLGQGGMATVYLAQDLKHDRRVAIKVLKPELAAVLGADRFVQEIRTTAQLQHPHILPLFDSGQADGFLYYVMPYIEGETLRDKLNRETQLGIEEAVRITTEVADALDYAHRQGVIHRDIKPENILLHDGRPMVADFGIALALSAAAGGRMTETGMSLGTPHYMSPEQATADKEITARSDVYSLGCVLYEMLTGQPPHLGGSAQQIIMKIVTEAARPVTEMRKSVPANVAAAVAQALEKLPADRFESARAFAAALTNPAFHTAVAVASGPGIAGTPSRLTAALGVVIVLLALALVWSLTSRGATPGPVTFDVGLPDSAPLAVPGEQPFVVSPAGDFVVYVADEGGRSQLWYRSLRDGTARRIEGADRASRPAISPDGTRLAFLRWPEDPNKWELRVVPIAGGAAATLGHGDGIGNLQWLDDGRLQVLDGDGTHAHWFDPGGGPTVEQPIRYCILPSWLPGRGDLLCGGGGQTHANLVPVRDTTKDPGYITGSTPGTGVFGTDFHVVEGRYLVYLSLGGDLLAAPIDLATGRTGRSVRLVTGIERTAYWGAGGFALSRSGTLVYVRGPNYAIGNLVATDGRSFDTLNVGRDAFHLFAMSPDGRRLAAIVDGLNGAELRVYDLATGEHVVLARSPSIRQPVWSPKGDHLIFGIDDSVFQADPDGAAAPRKLTENPGASFEPFTWWSEHQVSGGAWGSNLALVLDPGSQPVKWDTLMSGVAFPLLSPDGRWLAYNDVPLNNVWLSPVPVGGKRYQVGTGAEPVWLSGRELAFTMFGGDSVAEARVTIDASGGAPVFRKRVWAALPNYVETAGQSAQLTPDGRVLYVRSADLVPRPFLTVVPDWVRQMKRAVDAANR